MYIEIIFIVITFLVIYLCLRNKKEKFYSSQSSGAHIQWFNSGIYDSENDKQLYNLKKKDNYYTNSNLNPDARIENKNLGKKKMFYYETNTKDTTYDMPEKRNFLYDKLEDKEKEIFIKESREAPKISNKMRGSLYFNSKPSDPIPYDDRYGYIEDMSIEDFHFHQMKKKQDISEKRTFISAPIKNPDGNYEDIYNTYQDLVNKGLMKEENIPIQPNYYTSVPERKNGKNIFEIEKIIFKMPGKKIPINLSEITLKSDEDELGLEPNNSLKDYGVTAKFSANNEYNNEKNKTINIIDGKLGNMGHSVAKKNPPLLQSLILLIWALLLHIMRYNPFSKVGAFK